ncbi:hypothetical protein D3C75_1273060 [compost metagenome]
MSGTISTDWAMTMARVALCRPTSKALAIDCSRLMRNRRGTMKPMPRLRTQKLTTMPARAMKSSFSVA